MVGILISFRGPFSGAMLPSWWVSTHQTGSFPQIGMNIQNIWNHCNHHPVSCRECHINHLRPYYFSNNHLLTRRRRRWPIEKKKPSIQGGKVRRVATKWWRRSCFCYILRNLGNVFKKILNLNLSAFLGSIPLINYIFWGGLVWGC